MKKLTSILTLAFILLFALGASAQSFKYKKSINKHIFRSKKGKLKKSKAFDNYRGFYNGYCIVINDDKWGIINEQGEIVIDLKYEEVWILQNQFRFRSQKKIGLLNEQGEEIIPAEFDWVESMMDNKAVVRNNEKWQWWIDGELSQYEFNIAEFDEAIIVQDCIGQNSDCTMRVILTTLYKNIVYPEEARARRIEGTVSVRLIFNEDGKVEKKEVVEGLGYGCDQEYLRALDRINDLNIIGAEKDGQKVKLSIVLPLKFKLF